MSISNNAEKAFEVIQHPFMIKTLSDIEIQGNFLNSIKAIYKIPTVNVMFNGEILNAFPLRLEMRQEYAIQPHLFNMLKVLAS